MCQNPFKPTAGAEPPRIIGRDNVVLEFEQGLSEGVGAPGRLMRVTGPRGSGKTVLLADLAARAESLGWRAVNIWADPKMLENLAYELAPSTELDSLEIEGGVAVASGRATMSVKPPQLRALMKKAAQTGSGLLITIDEVQDASHDDMRTIANLVQMMIREKENVALVFAGLPTGVLDLINGRAMTFLRRAASQELGCINQVEVALSLRDSFAQTGLELSGDELSKAARATGGYAFLIQLVGYYVWQRADLHRDKSIEVGSKDVEEGVAIAMSRFDEVVYKPALAGLSQKARDFVKAMAQIGETASTADVAKHLGLGVKGIDATRRSLIQKQVLYSPARGYLEFAIPFVRDYILEHEDEL